jgi:rod shape-determining protein MreC
MLLTDPDSRVAGLVDRSRETGLLVGRAGGRCEFMYLDVDADIQDGDRIVTAGLGGPFPKGLFLGRVARVVRDELTGSARASVVPAARLGRLEEVLCLPPVAPAAERPRGP